MTVFAVSLFLSVSLRTEDDLCLKFIQQDQFDASWPHCLLRLGDTVNVRQ